MTDVALRQRRRRLGDNDAFSGDLVDHGLENVDAVLQIIALPKNIDTGTGTNDTTGFLRFFCHAPATSKGIYGEQKGRCPRSLSRAV
jgi:hypothetical protein